MGKKERLALEFHITSELLNEILNYLELSATGNFLIVKHQDREFNSRKVVNLKILLSFYFDAFNL